MKDKPKSDLITLTPKECEKLFVFSISRIAILALSANPKSKTYKQAVSAIKNKDIKKGVMGFIKYYNSLKNKP